MRIRHGFELPPELEPVIQRAKRLEWVTLACMGAIVIAIYLTLGGSQAMKAAWIEDMLSFVAPIAFLVSARYRHRTPNDQFPYGYHRSATIAFLAGAIALTLFGVIILTDSAMSLIRADRPTIGTTMLFGHLLWSGWIMAAVLFLSGIPPFVLGRMKMNPAHQLAPSFRLKSSRTASPISNKSWLT